METSYDQQTHSVTINAQPTRFSSDLSGYYDIWIHTTKFAKAVTVVCVRFEDAAGNALENPHKVAITVGANDRTQQLRAVIMPPDIASAVSLSDDIGGRISISNINTQNNVITFDLVGVTESIVPGDAPISAMHTSAGLLCSHPISVVIPSDQIHVNPPQGAATTIVVNDAKTDAAGQWFFGTEYRKDVKIDLYDQFADRLGVLYDDAVLHEQFIDANGQQLSNRGLMDRATPVLNGTFNDPVGRIRTTVAAPQNQNPADAARWIAGTLQIPNTVMIRGGWRYANATSRPFGCARQRIWVDGFELASPWLRTVNTTAPETTDIEDQP